MTIGLLNEGSLHQSLKALYGADGAAQEVAVGAYVADLMSADRVIYEIQTSGFARLRRKLEAVLETYRVVLVHPVAAVRHIVRLDGTPDELVRARRSPKKGTVADVLVELVSLPRLLNHPNFELEVVLVEEEEFRRHDPGRVRRRNGWAVVQRRLRQVVGRRRFRSAADLFGLVTGPLPEPFTTAELALAMGHSRALAQKLAFCLRESGEIAVCGKRGNALLYRRSNR